MIFDIQPKASVKRLRRFARLSSDSYFSPSPLPHREMLPKQVALKLPSFKVHPALLKGACLLPTEPTQ